ncbi:hypothetical protein CV102_13180 [Natronococcus pandeyae]|uniref:Uncharacterized protein n=1 Tax=Natronococcus pandeyae TaxID=2055836 RepID=A0A8J8TQ66_9EURY|nr:hypothetical protein CV102_13180 [Natronococcus pandeyae]
MVVHAAWTALGVRRAVSVNQPLVKIFDCAVACLPKFERPVACAPSPFGAAHRVTCDFRTQPAIRTKSAGDR